ncbi:MAG TPA: methyltransferase domain-containing protein [Thermoleophilaceae bacterium]|nr:methyltransferase domain-containing protein [Thermoleophilaceae bacterium]
MADLPTGALGLSESLRKFVAEFPYERESILAFVMRAAQATPTGARVADVGAGDAPFRELFAHTQYATLDWTESVHEGARSSDIVASADSIPVRDGAFDAVLFTQVLEHVPEPSGVMSELHRILAHGGTLYLTAPLVWELHELPHDYYRYTSEGLRHLLEGAGFTSIEIEPRNDCFTTLAQLMLNARWAMGSAPDGLDERRGAARELLEELAEQLAQLAPLDAERVLPLGYAATGVRA